VKTRVVVGLAAFVLTIAVMIPALFFLSRGAVSFNQYFVIVAAVLSLVLWTIPYATLVDPWLRRGVGTLFNITIEWRGTSNSLSWTPVEETGCLVGLFVDVLGYFFIILWLLPFGAAIALVFWFRH
jgi:hypothetical protein